MKYCNLPMEYLWFRMVYGIFGISIVLAMIPAGYVLLWLWKMAQSRWNLSFPMKIAWISFPKRWMDTFTRVHFTGELYNYFGNLRFPKSWAFSQSIQASLDHLIVEAMVTTYLGMTIRRLDFPILEMAWTHSQRLKGLWADRIQSGSTCYHLIVRSTF